MRQVIDVVLMGIAMIIAGILATSLGERLRGCGGIFLLQIFILSFMDALGCEIVYRVTDN